MLIAVQPVAGRGAIHTPPRSTPVANLLYTVLDSDNDSSNCTCMRWQRTRNPDGFPDQSVTKHEVELVHCTRYCMRMVQDENRHGDFFAAIMKARSEYLQDWQSKLWSRFFCHSVYITMYLNDHQRSSFYQALGLNTKQFNQHVIIETNNSTARLFPAVCPLFSSAHARRRNGSVWSLLLVASLSQHGSPARCRACGSVWQAALVGKCDCLLFFYMPKNNNDVHFSSILTMQVPDTNHPEYWNKMERLVELNTQLLALNKSDSPAILRKLQQAPIIERMVANVWQLFIMKPAEIGSVDVNEPAAAY